MKASKAGFTKLRKILQTNLYIHNFNALMTFFFACQLSFNFSFELKLICLTLVCFFFVFENVTNLFFLCLFYRQVKNNAFFLFEKNFRMCCQILFFTSSSFFFQTFCFFVLVQKKKRVRGNKKVLFRG